MNPRRTSARLLLTALGVRLATALGVGLAAALGVGLALPLGGCGAPTGGPGTGAATTLAPGNAPPLAVVLVIDQLRTDTLARLTPILEGGLGRLLREGRLFTQGEHPYATNETGPGHATISTGVPPSKHGIIGNRWYARPGGHLVTCTHDPSAPNHTGQGSLSARFLQATTVGEWLKQASPESRVVSIGGKDRSAALLAGRQADAVLFYDPRAGRFTSSTAWAPTEPELLLEFDRTRPLAPLACAAWDPLSGTADRPEAGPDDSPWEPEGKRTFPHRLPCPAGAEHHGPGTGAPDDHAPASAPGPDEATLRSLARELPFTPFFDTLTLELAEVALDAYGLGRDATPDLLLVSLAGTDYVGHRYGPESQELLDQIRRLDLRLDLFLRALDERLGKGKALVVLTSDHGVADTPESKPESGARRVMSKEFDARVEARLVAALGPPPPRRADGPARWLLGVEGYHVYLADPAPRVVEAAAAAIGAEELVDKVYTAAELEAGSAAGTGAAGARSASPSVDPLLELARASTFPGHSGDLLIRAKPGWFLTTLETGSDHGTPWEYDRRVPILFSGAGIRPGLSRDAALTTQVAPTVAARLGVPVPEGVAPALALPEGR